MPPDPSPYLTVPALKHRGWTDALIRDHLGTPDREAPNPHYRSAAPMRLYLVTRVEACEQSPDFAEAKTIAAQRSARGRRAADAKRAEARAWVERLTITVPQMEPSVLLERACTHYNRAAHVPDWVLERQEWDRPAATPDSNRDFLQRITVNWLRHQMTNYERLLDATYGKVGAQDLRLLVAHKVFDAIAATYPHLGEECARQYTRRVQDVP